MRETWESLILSYKLLRHIKRATFAQAFYRRRFGDSNEEV